MPRVLGGPGGWAFFCERGTPAVQEQVGLFQKALLYATRYLNILDSQFGDKKNIEEVVVEVAKCE